MQLGAFHSLDRLGHKLVLIGVKAELVPLAGVKLFKLGEHYWAAVSSILWLNKTECAFLLILFSLR